MPTFDVDERPDLHQWFPDRSPSLLNVLARLGDEYGPRGVVTAAGDLWPDAARPALPEGMTPERLASFARLLTMEGYVDQSDTMLRWAGELAAQKPCNFADKGVLGAEATADYCYAHQDFCKDKSEGGGADDREALIRACDAAYEDVIGHLSLYVDPIAERKMTTGERALYRLSVENWRHRMESAAPVGDESSTATGGEGEAEAVEHLGVATAGECSGSPATDLRERVAKALYELAHPAATEMVWETARDLPSLEGLAAVYWERADAVLAELPDIDALTAERDKAKRTLQRVYKNYDAAKGRVRSWQAEADHLRTELAALRASIPEVPEGHELVVLSTGVVHYCATRWDSPGPVNTFTIGAACRAAIARRPKPEPETERVPVWKAEGRETTDGRTVTSWWADTFYGASGVRFDDRSALSTPDGTVEVLRGGS